MLIIMSLKAHFFLDQNTEKTVICEILPFKTTVFCCNIF